MLIDTHAHLTDEIYSGKIEETLNNAKQNGVERVIISSYNFSSCLPVLNLAKKHDSIFCTLGIHPEDVQDFMAEAEKFIEENAKHEKVVAIGEIGLDYHYEGFDKAKQKEIFVKQLKLADKLGLPVVIHNRDSIGDMLEILQKNKKYLKHGGIFHCFSESVEIFEIVKKLGFKIGIGGVITFKNAKKLVEVVEKMELGDFVLETDSPYLCPNRGQINQPKYVLQIAQKIADLKNMEIKTIEENSTKNAFAVFKKLK